MSHPAPSTQEPRYLIALFEAGECEGSTVHSFCDPALWAWLHRAEAFPTGAESIEVPIPGTDRTAHVTVYDPVIDKAIHLVCLPGTGGVSHPALTEVRLGARSVAEYCRAYAKLRDEIGSDRVVEGEW